MTDRTVKWHPLGKALPDGWELVPGQRLGTHHNAYSILIRPATKPKPDIIAMARAASDRPATRCPTAAAWQTTASIPAEDRAALEAHARRTDPITATEMERRAGRWG